MESFLGRRLFKWIIGTVFVVAMRLIVLPQLNAQLSNRLSDDRGTDEVAQEKPSAPSSSVAPTQSWWYALTGDPESKNKPVAHVSVVEGHQIVISPSTNPANSVRMGTSAGEAGTEKSNRPANCKPSG